MHRSVTVAFSMQCCVLMYCVSIVVECGPEIYNQCILKLTYFKDVLYSSAIMAAGKNIGKFGKLTAIHQLTNTYLTT